VAVIDRDVENDPEAAQELANMGLKILPVSVQGDRQVIGFNAKELIETFGLSKGGDELPDPEWMLEKFRFVFEATKRAVRQIPPDKLTWETPKRKRDLRMLTWHIFERIRVCLESLEVGEYTRAAVTNYRKDMDYEAAGLHTPEDICAYGDEVEKELEPYLIGDKTILLEKLLPTYAGEKMLHQLLDMALAHCFQHLRQTYEYLKMLEIAPDRPLTEKDYEGIPVTKDLF
jgi:hypothetical protein